MPAFNFESTVDAPLEQVYVYAKQRYLKEASGAEWDDANHRCIFPLTNAAFGKFEGIVDFIPEDGTTKIVINLDFEINAPLVGPMITDNILKFVHANLGSAMDKFKQEFEGHLRTLPRPASASPSRVMDTLPRNAARTHSTNDLPRPGDIE